MLTSASLFLVSAVNQFVSAADPVVMEDASDEYEDDGVFEFGAKALAPAIRLKAEKNALFLYIMIFEIEVIDKSANGEILCSSEPALEPAY